LLVRLRFLVKEFSVRSLVLAELFAQPNQAGAVIGGSTFRHRLDVSFKGGDFVDCGDAQLPIDLVYQQAGLRKFNGELSVDWFERRFFCRVRKDGSRYRLPAWKREFKDMFPSVDWVGRTPVDATGEELATFR